MTTKLMKYTTDENIIETANQCGSSAKTRKGAIKYLKTQRASVRGKSSDIFKKPTVWNSVVATSSNRGVEALRCYKLERSYKGKKTSPEKSLKAAIKTAEKNTSIDGLTVRFEISFNDEDKKPVNIISQISISVDHIHTPKNLKGEVNHPLWIEDKRIEESINEEEKVRKYKSKYYNNSTVFELLLFVRDHNQAVKSAKSNKFLAEKRAKIASLQKEQKENLKKMRAVNAEFLAGKKEKKEYQKKQLAAGNFWECDKKMLKDYFSPPFSKNYLADVSEKWRAALYVECESVSYKYGYGNNWGHKLSGTERGYLCGIDDNGDEWGHEVELLQSQDEYGNFDMDNTVEEAMSSLFEIDESRLSKCKRQGDLLFCETNITQTLELSNDWEVRESHIIKSEGLMRSGDFFKSNNEIKITHTSHEEVILAPGEYELYELQIVDAD